METFSRDQQIIIILIIFGMALLYFNSINQPEQIGWAMPANYRWAQPTLQPLTSKEIEKMRRSQPLNLSTSSKKLTGAQLLTLNKPINLNTATVKDLEAIPGIGQKTAENIVAYRKKHGKFAKIEDIMKVPGIKGKRFEKIKRYIAVK